MRRTEAVQGVRQPVFAEHLLERAEGRGCALLLDEEGRIDGPGRVVQRDDQIERRRALEPGAPRAVPVQHHPRADRDEAYHERGDDRSGDGRNRVRDRRIIDEMVDSVMVEQNGLAIVVNPGAVANGQSSRVIIPPAHGSREDSRAIRTETSNLLTAIAKARAYLDDLVAGRVLDVAQIAAREQRSVRSASMLLSLAFLAPDLVRAIVERRLPRGIGLIPNDGLAIKTATLRKPLLTRI
jgi:hypothetical protein